MPGPRSTAQEESADTRSRILQVAEEIFAEKGFSGARVAEIADRAGMDKRLIFYYFGSKKGLYSSILEEFFQSAGPLIEGFMKKRKEGALEIDLARFMETMTDYIHHHKRPVRILFREFLDGGELLEDLIPNRILPIFQLWRSYYPRLFPGYKKVSPREADHMLITLGGMELFYFLVEPLMEKVWQEDPMHPDCLDERKAFLRKRTKLLMH